MQIVKDDEPSFQLIAHQMTKWEQLKQRLYCLWLWKIRRRFPMLVWYGDDIDIRVTFTDLRLAPESVGHTNPDGGVTWDIRYEGDMETLWGAENALHQLGLTFDGGTSCDGRDWEWDYSLQGPIKLQFKKRHKGDRKAKEPRPPLKLVEGAGHE